VQVATARDAVESENLHGGSLAESHGRWRIRRAGETRTVRGRPARS